MDRKKQRKIQRQEKKKIKNLYYRHRQTNEIKSENDNVESNQKEPVKAIKKKKKRTTDSKTNPKSSALIEHQRRLILKEEREIKRYEKLLKLRSYTKRNKLPKSFHLDGLADLIEFCDDRNENDGHEDGDRLDDHDMEQSSNEESENVEQEVNSELNDENESPVEYSEDEDDSDEKNSDDGKLREDIYGFLRDKQGNIVPQQDKRMDHAQKEQFISDVVVNENVQRKLRGLLNRLTSSNIKVISNDIIKLNVNHSRHVINKGIMNCLDKIVIECEHSLPAKLFAELAMLIAILSFEMSDDVGGYFIHTLVCRFDAAFANVSTWNASSKRLNNILTLILNMHSTGLVDYQLIYDIIDKFCEKLDNEKSIEIIDSILKTSGFLLRKEDPARMKSLILRIQTLSQGLSEQMASAGSRVKFMLESLVAIKNNNVAKIKTNETVVMNDLIESTLKSVIKKPRVPSIPGQYSAILQSSHWFSYTKQIVPLESIKGGQQQQQSTTTMIDEQITLNEKVDTAKLDRLCRALRLNTPLRRQLFAAIFTCGDYLDAAGKLISIGKKQSSEIINVVLHVAINEKCYNHFYFYLLQHLTNLDRKYRLALDFAIRDKITDLLSLPANNRTKLEQLMCHLLVANCLSITCLKVIQFSDMNEMYVQFIRNILQFVFDQSDDSIVTMVLGKIPKKDNFASAIKLFIACFMDAQAKDRASSIKRLQSLSHSY